MADQEPKQDATDKSDKQSFAQPLATIAAALIAAIASIVAALISFNAMRATSEVLRAQYETNRIVGELQARLNVEHKASIWYEVTSLAGLIFTNGGPSGSEKITALLSLARGPAADVFEPAVRKAIESFALHFNKPPKDRDANFESEGRRLHDELMRSHPADVGK